MFLAKLYILNIWILKFMHIFPQFFPFSSRVQFRIPCYLQLSCQLSLSNLRVSLSLFFFNDLPFLKSTAKLLCWTLVCFLMSTMRLWILGKKTTEIMCLPHIKQCIKNESLMVSILDHLGEVGSTRFLLCKLYFFHILLIRNESLNPATLKGRGMNFYQLEGEALKSL